jgi:hypothetical protein
MTNRDSNSRFTDAARSDDRDKTLSRQFTG